MECFSELGQVGTWIEGIEGDYCWDSLCFSLRASNFLASNLDSEMVKNRQEKLC